LRIPALDPAYHTPAYGDAQTTASAEADVDVGGDPGSPDAGLVKGKTIGIDATTWKQRCAMQHRATGHRRPVSNAFARG
jgi:hypothetical protein